MENLCLRVSITLGQCLSNGESCNAIACPNLTYLWRHSRTALFCSTWSFLCPPGWSCMWGTVEGWWSRDFYHLDWLDVLVIRSRTSSFEMLLYATLKSSDKFLMEIHLRTMGCR